MTYPFQYAYRNVHIEICIIESVDSLSVNVTLSLIQFFSSHSFPVADTDGGTKALSLQPL